MSVVHGFTTSIVFLALREIRKFDYFDSVLESGSVSVLGISRDSVLFERIPIPGIYVHFTFSAAAQ